MIPYKFIFACLLVLSCAKHNEPTNDTQKVVESSVPTPIEAKEEPAVITENKKGDLRDFQGIWESFSYYLEHESEFKDYTKNKYYKIIHGNKILDIILIDQQLEHMKYNPGYLGFVDHPKMLPSSISKNDIKTTGAYLVRLHGAHEKYNTEHMEFSTTYSRDFEVAELLEDGFTYESDGKELIFRKIPSLPKSIFSALTVPSNTDAISHTKDFNLAALSQKVRVKARTTFFHDTPSDSTKRNAFLIQNDLAYLEAIEEDWAKVYYHGQTISGGYVKLTDVEKYVENKYDGIYTLSENDDCDVMIKISGVTYEIQVSDTTLLGTFEVVKGGDNTFLRFNDWIGNDPEIPIEGKYEDQTITIQNYGNAMNPYLRIEKCGNTKYLAFSKLKTSNTHENPIKSQNE